MVVISLCEMRQRLAEPIGQMKDKLPGTSLRPPVMGFRWPRQDWRERTAD